MTGEPLEVFTPLLRRWFTTTFGAPTAAQAEAWRVIAGGDHALLIAPTGSGKTLAAFLWSIHRLLTEPRAEPPAARVLYVSPLRALAADIERNLRAPLTAIRRLATETGVQLPDIRIGVRTGDTPSAQRRALVKNPPDILITTPESLFLLLTSQARDMLRGVDTVIIDEIHALAGNKRGAHLALSMERLEALLRRPAQRIGLSATVRPPAEAARFLGGGRPVRVIHPSARKELDIRVSVPVADMTSPPDPPPGAADEPDADTPARSSIWPHIVTRLVDLITAHRSTIVFTNSRRLAERLTAQLNDEAARRGIPGELARAHHGSVSREQRHVTEELLKSGRIPAVVATSSLELGIDMGAVDLVVHAEPPPSVAAAMQRFGRAGHQRDAVSRGIIFPKHRSQLIPAAVVVERMRDGRIEAVRVPENPLDVLAQQLVAMAATDDWSDDDMFTLVRRAAPFHTLRPNVFDAVLAMLAGRYASDDFAQFKARIDWDRSSGRVTARPGARLLAVTNAGTIPDRGQYTVVLAGADKPTRVGELDEEMVYESRPGTVFTLGSAQWRIVDITADRVVVVPAPGAAAIPPFWHGDAPARPFDLGRAIGETLRVLSSTDQVTATAALRDAGFDELAVNNALRYLADQRAATGVVPDDQTIVVEWFRDEVGDWRLVVHSPFGGQVHAPWALAIAARIRQRYGIETAVMHADDGIVARLPAADRPPDLDLVTIDPDEAADAIRGELTNSALFAAKFRECAARALLLPRRFPQRRTPLWQQRQRAAQLLSAAVDLPDFPIVLEAVRECWHEVFDVPGLQRILRDIAAHRIAVVGVETPVPSPFARSLLFGYLAAYLYENDVPPAERKVHALALDSALLTQLLGEHDFAEILDPGIVAAVEQELASLPQSPTPTLDDAVRAFAARRGPFSRRDLAAALAADDRQLDAVLDHFVTTGVLVRSGAGEYCDADILRTLRRRSLAKLRAEIEPVPARAFARFLPSWQHVRRPLTGVDGLYAVIEQLRGARLPASELEQAILARRIAGYHPALLDELTASGAVTWTGAGARTGSGTRGAGARSGAGTNGPADGWIVLCPTDAAASLLPPPMPLDELPVLHRHVVDLLASSGALFFRTIADRVRCLDDQELERALWDLVFAGWLTNDTLAPLRARLTQRPGSRPRGRPILPSRLGPPTAAGRWSLIGARESDEERRARALAQALLDRYGVAARPVVEAENVRGGFGGIYPVLATMEAAGACRRGYFVTALGGAQFGVSGAIDALRAANRETAGPLVLAAADPRTPTAPHCRGRREAAAESDGVPKRGSSPSTARRCCTSRAAAAASTSSPPTQTLSSPQSRRSPPVSEPAKPAGCSSSGSTAGPSSAHRSRRRYATRDFGPPPRGFALSAEHW